MEYQSLYRRYRPGRFDAVRGQEHVVRALRNAVRENRVSHLYLLSGPRGTGKTTLARILAKVLNCENPVDAEPCGECGSCKSVEAGNSFDLHELDAASNNRVDDMRDLLSKVALGTPGRTKVYLLDEVHMLSSGAENALLKTLEEPPDHVIFVLATTEPHKVVPTIRSRAQHLELTLLGADELTEHVRWVLNDAGLSVDEEAIDHVVRVGGGSVRDTLSALDQVLASGGVAHRDTSSEALLEAISDYDASKALTAIGEALRQGRDSRVIGEGLLVALRNVLLVALGAGSAQMTEGERAQADVFAGRLSPPRVTRALEVIGTALVEMRQAPDPRIDLEVALVRLTVPSADTTLASLAERVTQLEDQLASGLIATGLGSASTVTTSNSSPPPAVAAPSAAPARPGRSDAPPPRPGRSGPAAEARSRLASMTKGSSPPPRPNASNNDDAQRASESSIRPANDGQRVVRAPAEPAPKVSTITLDAPSPPDTSEAVAAPESERSVAVANREPAGAAAPIVTGNAASALDADAIRARWDDVLGAMSRKAKVRFSGVSVSAVVDGTVVIAFPNDVHRSRAAEFLSEFESALTSQLPTKMPVKFVTDDVSGSGPPARGDGGRNEPPPSDEPEDVIDLTELTDAPGGGTIIDQLTSAFPGAELVDGD